MWHPTTSRQENGALNIHAANRLKSVEAALTRLKNNRYGCACNVVRKFPKSV
jgi:RNA polymerase-binding transcription factor DksA